MQRLAPDFSLARRPRVTGGDFGYKERGIQTV